MNCPAYPRYKDSGVQWLGEVPEHWEVKRGRFTMRVNPPAPLLRNLEEDREVSFVPMDAVNEYGGIRLDQTRVKTEVGGGYTEFQDGDVVIAKITPCFENGKGSLVTGLVNSAAYGTTELHVLRASLALDYRFLFYLTITDGYRKLGESEMYGAGGQKRVPPEFCKDFLTPLPPIYEQTAIADFLDRETGRIDTLVAKKRRLIALLGEKRTALISRTVTRGLPADAAREFGLKPHTRFKDSGIEWLGEVPEGWEIVPLRHLILALDQGWSPTADSSPATEDQWGVLKLSAIREGSFAPSDNKALDDLPNGINPLTPNDGDVLISRANTPERVGDACLVKGEHPWRIIPDLIYRLQLDRKKVLPVFVVAFLLSRGGRAQIQADARGSNGSMVKLGQSHLRSWLFPLPSLLEQTAIATYLDRETAKIDQLVAKVEAAIARLLEYRTALITAAVTGKIDVRGTSKD